MKPIAILHITNDLVLEVYSIINCVDDYLTYKYSDEKLIDIKSATINYDDSSGEAFFVDCNNKEYYISEFLKMT